MRPAAGHYRTVVVVVGQRPLAAHTLLRRPRQQRQHTAHLDLLDLLAVSCRSPTKSFGTR